MEESNSFKGSPPLVHNNMLESNPLKSRFLVCGLAVVPRLIFCYTTACCQSCCCIQSARWFVGTSLQRCQPLLGAKTSAAGERELLRNTCHELERAAGEGSITVLQPAARCRSRMHLRQNEPWYHKSTGSQVPIAAATARVQSGPSVRCPGVGHGSCGGSSRQR